MSEKTPNIDVTADPCPMSFVKAKLALEDVAVGQRLTVTLRGGEACNNVPRSFKMEGHEVVELTPLDDDAKTWRLVVERRR